MHPAVFYSIFTFLVIFSAIAYATADDPDNRFFFSAWGALSAVIAQLAMIAIFRLVVVR